MSVQETSSMRALEQEAYFTNASLANGAPANGISSVSYLQDSFEHWSGAPADFGAEHYLPIAWRTMAEGYVRTGLATAKAVDTEGYLLPIIDKSRHLNEGIKYFVATNPEPGVDQRSTARLVDAVSAEELPTYSLTGENIYEENRDKLFEMVRAGVRLRELGALANSGNGFSLGASEILRKVIVDTVTSTEESKQVLFVSMVDKTREGLLKTLSPQVLKPMGAPTVLKANEYRLETTLVPILIEPDNVLENIVRAYKRAERPAEKQRYLRSALFYSAPFEDQYLPDDLASIRAAAVTQLMRNRAA